MTLKVAFVSRDPMIRLAGARALELAPEEWEIVLAEDAPPDADVIVRGPDVSGGPGIEFDPTRPDRLLETIAASAQRGFVVAIAGACGGCGVTSIALHVARHYGSCIVECGVRAGLAERLGLERDGLKTWGSDDPEEEWNRLSALPMAGGFRASFAPPDQPTGIDVVPFAAAGWFRRVVLDVPFGDDLPQMRDALVLVMPATRPGAQRARELLHGVPDSSTRAIVANRVGAGGETTRSQLERILGERIALELPCCPALRDAEDDGSLLPPRHRWARRVDKLAGALVSRSAREAA